MIYSVLAGALAFSPARQLSESHALAHGHGNQLCGCEKDEADHPFTIDCSATAAIRAATTTLESSTCTETRSDTFEWGASFATPDASYKWVAQAKGGAWADPTMKLVIFDIAEDDVDTLFTLRDQANTLMAGTCTAVADGGSMSAASATGTCYQLTFPTATNDDFIATVTTGTSNGHTAFFAEHLPTEFEESIHYLMQAVDDADLGLASTVPNEPVSDTDMYCKIQADGAGVKTCQTAFFVLQAHHDYCSHDTLTRYEEELVHTWESKCKQCAIERKYDATLKNCPQIDCSDTSVIDAAYYVLAGRVNDTYSISTGICTPADTTYAFEWGGSFETPDATYKWVSQAKTNSSSQAAWADPSMKLVIMPMTATGMGDLFNLQDAADTLMESGPCPVVNDHDTIATAAAGGSCYTLTFPTATTDDFVVTVTTGDAKTAFFAEHVPTEFEESIHYLMQDVPEANLGLPATVPNEPVAEVPTGGGHDHGHRRRMAESSPSFLSTMAAGKAWARPRKGRANRKLADAGSCCNNAAQQGAWKQVVAYHDLCDHDDVPTYVELGFHDYEESCEDYFCNAVASGYDGTICPSPPSPPPKKDDDTIETSTVIIIVVIAAVVVAFLFLCVCTMFIKEKQGKPMFTNLEGVKAQKTDVQMATSNVA